MVIRENYIPRLNSHMSTVATTPSTHAPSQAPAPSCGHTLIFYEDDSALLDGLSQSICAAICSGNSAIIIATAAHHDGLVAFLRARCAEAHTAIIEGRLFLLDAEETLTKIMVNGQLDPDRCISVIGNYIEMLEAAARGNDPKVFAFGELVSILWQRGNQAAALHLELLCRQLVEHRPLMQLCCGYPLHLFPSDTGPTPILAIRSRRTRILHSKDVPTAQ
jgi:MEDS: MEthanogen/methylotroph, DcmR Sensory domain